MRKKISWLFLLTVFLSLFSCRNDYFPEPGTRQYNNASQFQVVKFSDIPQVARFIKLKTGRNDLKIPIKSAHGFSAEAKANIDFANLETNFIIKKTENNRVFYISNISNAGDENTLYNFEAREAGGSIVDARIIEYSSEVPFGEKPLEVLADFTGRVRMYDLQGKEKTGITFINGGETCDDNPADPSSNSGGGGGSGGDDTPPPPPPSPPNWPQNPVPVYGGGGNGGGSNGSSGSGSGSSGSGGSGTNCGSWQLSHYLYDGPCNGPACSNIVGAVFVNACNESMPVYLSQNKNSNYAAKTTNFSVPCGGNSGVVVVEPSNEPKTDCERLYEKTNDVDLKHKLDSIATLVTKTNPDKHETGFVARKTSTIKYKIFQGTSDITANGTKEVVLERDVASGHNHPPGSIPIFSPSDLVIFYSHYKDLIEVRKNEFVMFNANFNGTIYAFRMQDTTALDVLFAGLDLNADTGKKAAVELIRKIYDKEGKLDINLQYTAAMAEKMLMKSLNSSDIGANTVLLYQFENDTWKKLTSKPNGEIQKIPCP